MLRSPEKKLWNGPCEWLGAHGKTLFLVARQADSDHSKVHIRASPRWRLLGRAHLFLPVVAATGSHSLCLLCLKGQMLWCLAFLSLGLLDPDFLHVL